MQSDSQSSGASPVTPVATVTDSTDPATTQSPDKPPLVTGGGEAASITDGDLSPMMEGAVSPLTEWDTSSMTEGDMSPRMDARTSSVRMERPVDSGLMLVPPQPVRAKSAPSQSTNGLIPR